MTRCRRVMTMVTLSFALTGAVMIAGQRTADVALRAAVETETVRGDVKGAIEQYKQIVETVREERSADCGAGVAADGRGLSEAR